MKSAKFLDSHGDLLEAPLFAHVATLRPDDTPQVNPMWFVWRDGVIRLTCTTDRQKHQNVVHDPRVSLSVNDPESPYRYIEVRGRVVAIEPDPDGTFFTQLADRYGMDFGGPPEDKARRVVLVVRPEAFSGQ